MVPKELAPCAGQAAHASQATSAKTTMSPAAEPAPSILVREGAAHAILQ